MTDFTIKANAYKYENVEIERSSEMRAENYAHKDHQFYPTPTNLAERMARMVDFTRVTTILEPSAGKGDMIKGIKRFFKDSPVIDCVETDNHLRAILKDNKLNVVGDDFLSYRTYTQYDLIIMNPPFKDGEKHLLRALDMCKSGGQVCCLLNARTLKDPSNVYRQDLLRKLEEYDAKIEYIADAFHKAERRTGVEIALIYVDIPKQKYGFEFFSKMTASTDYESIYTEQEHNELATNDIIGNVLKQYDNECRLGLDFLNQYDKILSIIPTAYGSNKELIQVSIPSHKEKSKLSRQNLFLREMRYKYWSLLFQTKELSSLFTDDVRNELYSNLESFKQYDFTFSNIKALQIELSKNLSSNIEDAILKQFEKLTYTHSMGCSKNVHYFNGWKTNDAYMINKKVIIPCYGLFDSRFNSWSLYEIKDSLDELEKIFNYLDGGKTEGDSLQDVLYANSQRFQGETIEFKYFRVESKKKGTLHVFFKDLELLKKFNIFGANKKGWLPNGYGKKSYQDMTTEEQAVINEFQGEKDYAEVCKNNHYYTQLGASKMLLPETA